MSELQFADDVLARIEAAAARADIDGALAGLARLPDKAREPAQDWIARARARGDEDGF